MVYDLAFLKPIENANEGSDCEVLLPPLFIKYHLLLFSSEAKEERDRWHKRVSGQTKEVKDATHCPG